MLLTCNFYRVDYRYVVYDQEFFIIPYNYKGKVSPENQIGSLSNISDFRSWIITDWDPEISNEEVINSGSYLAQF